MTDYEIQLLNGKLYVNGQLAEDFLDCVDRRYSVTTSAERNAELYRLMRLVFSAGAASVAPLGSLMNRFPLDDGFVVVPVLGEVD